MIFAPVDEVKVYQNGAVVRRKTTVSLQPGTNEVIISGLSDRADPDSLRLFFSPGVVGKDVQIFSLSEAVGRLPSDDLNEEITELQSQSNTLKKMEELWFSNGNYESRGECSNETVESYLEALPGHLEKLRAQQRELCNKILALRAEKEKLEKKESFQVVRLILESADACEAGCEMEYFERSAQWKSTYELHAVADCDEISVVSRARITQQTGEDWENARVSLSTGNPTVQQKIPTLKKLGLRFELVYKNRFKPNFLPLGAAKATRLEDDDFCSAPMMAASAPVEKMVMEDAEESEAQTMTIYNLPGRRTVPSGALGTMADLKTDKVRADMRIVCIPKLDNNAYLAAMVKTEDWPLKPSSAKIYLNENYCGEIYIAPNPAVEEIFMISLGRDERISIDREEIRSKTENVIFKGQKRRISEYAIRIGNKTDKTLTVLVWDQIPVSSEKQIIVDNVSADGASVDKDTGKLNWSVTVNGKSTVEKRLAYTVCYPKDKAFYEVLTDTASGFKRCPECGAYVEGEFCPECGRRLE